MILKMLAVTAIAIATPLTPITQSDRHVDAMESVRGDARIDPIVTGVRVTGAQKKRWVENRLEFQICPECFEQDFPS